MPFHVHNNLSYEELYSYVLDLEDLLSRAWEDHRLMIEKIKITWHEEKDGSLVPSVMILQDRELLG